MAATAAPSRRNPDRAVPRHAGGRARRGGEHARRLPPRPRRFRRLSRRPRRRAIARADTDDLRGYLATRSTSAGLPPRRSRGGCRRSASSTGSSTPKAIASDDPAAVHRRAEARPRAAEGAVDRGRRPPARAARATRSDGRSARASGCARRGSPACSKLLYATGLRVSELVALPVSAARARRAHADGARQGRQGTDGAAQRRRQERDDGVSRAARGSAAQAGKSTMAVSRRSARAAT